MPALKLRIPLFIVLITLLQYAFELTNRQFYLAFFFGLILIVVILGITHIDEVESDEAVEKMIDHINKEDKESSNISTDSNEFPPGRLSGHKPPKIM